MADVYRLKVRWSGDIEVEDSGDYPETGWDLLYMVLRRRYYKGKPGYTILYIGMAYSQWLSDRLHGHHKLWEMIEEQRGKGKAVLRFGEIVLPEGRRISKKLLEDVEAALIHNEQPVYNQMGVQAYGRTRDVRILNLGRYKPLDRIVDTSEWG